MAPEFTSENSTSRLKLDHQAARTTNDAFVVGRINTENVKELKGNGPTKIGQNATAAKFSAEDQALEYEGTIFISDGRRRLRHQRPHGHRLGLRTHLLRTRSGNRLLRLGTTRVAIARAWSSVLAAERRPGRARPVDRQVLGQPTSKRRRPLLDHLGAALLNGQGLRRASGRRVRIRGRLTPRREDGKDRVAFWTTGPKKRGDPGRTGTDKHGVLDLNIAAVNPETRLFFSTSNACHGSAIDDRAKPLHRIDRRRWTPKNRRIQVPLPGGPPPTSGTSRAEPTVLMKGRKDGKKSKRSASRRRPAGPRRGSGNCKPVYPSPRSRSADPSQKHCQTLSPSRRWNRSARSSDAGTVETAEKRSPRNRTARKSWGKSSPAELRPK